MPLSLLLRVLPVLQPPLCWGTGSPAEGLTVLAGLDVADLSNVWLSPLWLRERTRGRGRRASRELGLMAHLALAG